MIDTVPEAMLAISAMELQTNVAKASAELAHNDLQEAYRTLVPRYATRPEVHDLLSKIQSKAAADLISTRLRGHECRGRWIR